MTDIMYHGSNATPSKVREKGLEVSKGLEWIADGEIIEDPEGVYLTNTIKSAKKYGKHVYEIDLDKLPQVVKKLHFHREGNDGSEEWYYTDNISPQYIRSVGGKKIKKPIKERKFKKIKKLKRREI